MVTVERPGKNEEDVSDTVSITIEYVRFLIASVLSYDQQAALAGPSTSGEKELEGEHGINVQMYLQDSRFEDVETERDLYYQKIEYASLYNSSSQPVNKSLIQYTERQVQGRWPVIETYGYDQSHRLESFQATDAFYSGATLYSSYQRASASYSYDDLGRIETLQRNGYINSNTPSKLTFDNLSYSYGSSASLAPTEVSDASQHYHGRSTNSSYTGANNELHYNSAGDISSDENKNVKYEYNALGLVSKHLKWSPSTGQAEISYRYSADGQLVESIEKDFQGTVISRIYYRDGQRYDSQDGSVYVSHEVGALRIMPDGSSQRIYYQNDHLGNVMLAWSDLNGNGVIEASSELLEESAYFPYGLKRQEYRTQTGNVPFAYNGAEENSDWRLHLTTYRTMAPELALWGQVDPKAEAMYGYSPYSAMAGNPISFADPHGDIIDPITLATAVVVASKITIGTKIAIGVTATVAATGAYAATGGFAATGGCPTCPPPGTYGTYELPTVNVYANPPSGYYDQSAVRYGYNGTFEQWQAQYGFESFGFREAVDAWIQMHGADHQAYVKRMDGLDAARRMMFWYGEAFPAVASFAAPAALPYGVAAPKTFSYASQQVASNSSKILNTTSRQLQAKFKHASDFGVKGNWNSSAGSKFNSAINQHINSPGVRTIHGSYRGQSVIHHLHPKTGLNVMSTPSGQFVSGWKLNPNQLHNVLKHGGL